MPNKFSLKNLGLLFVAVGFLSIPGHAQAGFQWVAPSSLPDNQSSSVIVPSQEPMIVPEARGRPEVISPMVGSSSHVSGSGSISSEPIIIGGDAPVTPAQPFMANEMMEPASPAPSSISGATIVLGFAKNVPLAVALREILPPGYGFSIDSSVDMGVLVSFRGGKPWRETLKESLAPAGLVMREQGQMVSIGYPAASVARSAAAAPIITDSMARNSTPVIHDHFLALPPTMVEPMGALPSAVVVSGSGVSSAATSNVSAEAWDAERGDGLRKVLERWSHRAGIEINWMSEYDYPLQASVHFAGTFEDAVRNLLTGFETAHPQPVAELHSNSKVGETVLVVTTRGNVGE